MKGWLQWEQLFEGLTGLGWGVRLSAMSDNTKFLTVTETAELLGVDSRTVRRWLLAGKFAGAERLSDEPKSPYRIPETAVFEFQQKRKLNKS